MTDKEKRMKMRFNTLRSFVTFAVFTTVAVSLLGAGIFFYTKSSNTLKENYKKDFNRQLQQINRQVEDQINMVDSVYPLIMSNTLIREYLDPASASYSAKTQVEKRLEIERQLSYLLISTYLWDEKFINGVYIFQKDGDCCKVSLYEDGADRIGQTRTVSRQIPESAASLEIRTLDGDSHSLYFVRNIKSSYTGDSVASIVIDINQEAWKKAYGGNTDENWLIAVFNRDMQVVGHEDSDLKESYQALMDEAGKGETSFSEIRLGETDYYMASRYMESGGWTSVAAVPVDYLMGELNHILADYLKIFTVIISITLVFTVVLSRAITAPIGKMIRYIKAVADGEQLGVTPPSSMYSEFNQLADAFQAMLKQLDIYYNDNFQKQLLLKNTEIKALQSQMDPHFLFNILDTVAWKASMAGNEEIYQMVLSLGELLRANILSHEKDFVMLEEELKYVRFYIYLQQTRFEDKFTAEIHVEESLYDCMIPRFCIQPLAENSIVHGLEPKKGFGRLFINVIDQGDFLEVNVADNGVGFSVPEDLDSLEAEKDSGHTHIGLKNLNKRLTLLYGGEARLRIMSRANECTTISYRIPKNRGNCDDIPSSHRG